VSDAQSTSKSVSPSRQHTIHGAELSWLHLVLLTVLPERTAAADSPTGSTDGEVQAPPFRIDEHGLAVGDAVDLLDPEGVTLATLLVESTSTDRVGGLVQPGSGFSIVDHVALRPDPAAARAQWTDRPVWALWSDGSLTLAVREAARQAAREHGAAIAELVPVPTGHETSRAANAPVRAALAETTRDVADRLVVVPWPEVADVDLALRLRTTISAAYGATELLSAEPQPSDTVTAVPVRLLDVPSGQRVLSSDLLDAWVLDGTVLPEWAAEEAVADVLARVHRPASRSGLTILLSGLSGSGKSTVARSLAVRLVEHETRSVSLLDGDVVRHHLSKGLGFSRPDRITNVLRIGFVASEITKAGGIAVCCPIAPYDQTRRQVRAMVEEHGRFVLVHVATPLSECERRDRKGLYAKARRGEIPEFTGISDPYETPDDAEVVIDTTGRTIEACVDDVYDYLVSHGLLDR
jgi:sulfate adenylyltransferase